MLPQDWAICFWENSNGREIHKIPDRTKKLQKKMLSCRNLNVSRMCSRNKDEALLAEIPVGQHAAGQMPQQQDTMHLAPRAPFQLSVRLQQHKHASSEPAGKVSSCSHNIQKHQLPDSFLRFLQMTTSFAAVVKPMRTLQTLTWECPGRGGHVNH